MTRAGLCRAVGTGRGAARGASAVTGPGGREHESEVWSEQPRLGRRLCCGDSGMRDGPAVSRC